MKLNTKQYEIELINLFKKVIFLYVWEIYSFVMIKILYFGITDIL